MVFTAVPAKGKKKKGKMGKAPTPQAGPRETGGGIKEPQLPQPPKGQQGPGQGIRDPPMKKGNQTTDAPAPQPSTEGGGKWTTVVKRGARKNGGQAGTVRLQDTPALARPKEAGKKPASSQPQSRAYPSPSQTREGEEEKSAANGGGGNHLRGR